MLGINTLLVDDEDRYFESETGDYRLRVNPRYDHALVEHFDRATRLRDTDLELSRKIAHIVDYVYRHYQYNKATRNKAIKEFPKTKLEGGQKVGVRSLGSLLDVRDSAVTCWEKAAFCHLLLAEIGVESILVGGTRKGSGGHAWLKLDLGSIIIDPTWRKIESKSYHASRYTPVNEKKIAFPLRRVDDTTLRTALIEARKYLYQNKLLFEIGHEQLLLEHEILKVQRRREQYAWESYLRNVFATPVDPTPPELDPTLDTSLFERGGIFEL